MHPLDIIGGGAVMFLTLLFFGYIMDKWNGEGIIHEKFEEDKKEVADDLPSLCARDQETVIDAFIERWSGYIPKDEIDNAVAAFTDIQFAGVIEDINLHIQNKNQKSWD